MTDLCFRREFLQVTGAGAVASLAGCGFGNSSPTDKAEAKRDELSKYRDVSRAVEDGYQLTTPYVRTDEGVLGLPFVNLDVPELDPDEPQVLFYNLREDGTYELLGVEWLVHAEGRDQPPSLFGKEFTGPTPGETAFIPEHYGLHVWLFDENPDGLFAEYHTAADPPSYIEELEAVWEALDPYFANADLAEQEGGYRNTERCIETADGGYGVPFVNTAFDGTVLDEPAVLLYRLTGTWNYQLLGAEWYVSAAEQSSPPSLLGQSFHGPMDGHSPEFDQGSHYGLHAWLYTANPAGMFAPYNPMIRC